MSASRMILYKSWLDTRWRFFGGLAILTCMAIGLVLVYPQLNVVLPLADGLKDSTGVMGELRKAIDLSRSFEGYQWVKWYNGNLALFGSVFAVLLGTGSIFAPAGVYTLALPVSRRRQLIVRAGLGLAELLAMIMLPSLAVVLVAPSVGESVSFASAAVHGACAFVAASLFFSFTLFLATVFSDVWRPMMLGFAFAAANLLAEMFFGDQLPFGVLRTMSAASYFSDGAIPWPGLAICAAGSLVLISAAAFNLERRDF